MLQDKYLISGSLGTLECAFRVDDRLICSFSNTVCLLTLAAALAQLGERQTEDLKAPCSIHGGGIAFLLLIGSQQSF